MLWNLIRKEFLNHILGFRFITSALLCGVVVGTSIIVLRGDYLQRQRDFDANRVAYRHQAEGRGSYVQLEQQGVQVDRPPQKTSIFFYGLDRTPDRTATVSGLFRAAFQGKLDINPVIPMFPVVDVLFVVAIVVSLLSFVFSYDAISGEREEGTLKLLLSYSLPRDRLILAKWIGGYVSLVIPLVIALLAASVVVLFSQSVGFRGTDWAALALGAVVSLLFIAAMFSVGVFVSTLCARSSTSISILLFIWVIFVLIIPNISPYLAGRLAPIEPISKVENEVRQRVGDVVSTFMQEIQAYQQEHGSEIRTPEGGKAFQEWIEKKYEELKVAMNEAGKEVMEQFERQSNTQLEVAQGLSRISPVASYIYAATDLAGTGVRAEQRLRDVLKRYQQDFKAYVARKTEEQKKKGRSMWERGEFDLSDMPVFQYTPGPISERLSGALTDIALLAIFTILFFLAAFLSFLRRDVI